MIRIFYILIHDTHQWHSYMILYSYMILIIKILMITIINDTHT